MKERVTFLISKELLEKIKNEAWKNKKNLSEYIREVLKEKVSK